MRSFFKNQDGMGTIEAVIIISVLVLVAILLFKPFMPQIIDWIKGVFS